MRQKWEYLIVYVTDSKVAEDGTEVDTHLDADTYTDKLQTYGEAGWEMVSFVWEADGAKVAFKRPKEK
jgi:hypothetical protein